MDKKRKLNNGNSVGLNLGYSDSSSDENSDSDHREETPVKIELLAQSSNLKENQSLKLSDFDSDEEAEEAAEEELMEHTVEDPSFEKIQDNEQDLDQSESEIGSNPENTYSDDDGSALPDLYDSKIENDNNKIMSSEMNEKVAIYLSILDHLNLDLFASFDLELPKIKSHKEFKDCKGLPMGELERLFESYLKDLVDKKSSTPAKISQSPVSPEEQLMAIISCLPKPHPKSFTDFNRKMRNNEEYKSISLDHKTKSNIYLEWIKSQR